MSKAFTSEETPVSEPVTRPPPRVAPGEARYVTPEGAAELRATLERLCGEAADARQLPDPLRTERLADLDRRAAHAEATLATLTVLGADAAPEGVVAFATWVTVEDEDGRRATWRIVGPDEADAKRRQVSASAPLAAALLGHRAGDVVEVERPGGTVEVTVVDVRRAAPGEAAEKALRPGATGG